MIQPSEPPIQRFLPYLRTEGSRGQLLFQDRDPVAEVFDFVHVLGSEDDGERDGKPPRLSVYLDTGYPGSLFWYFFLCRNVEGDIKRTGPDNARPDEDYSH